MSKSAIIHARIEIKTKKKAEAVLNRLGLSPTEAIRLFYHQICLRSGLPFPVNMPNAETTEVLRKSKNGEDVETFDSLDEMFRTWSK